MLPDPIPPSRELADRFRRALERLPDQGGAEEAEQQAAALFSETFGTLPSTVSSARGYAPLVAEHTAFFPGFGLLLRLPGGTGVAVGKSEGAGALTAIGVEATRLTRLFEVLQHRLSESQGSANLKVAITSTMIAGGDEAVWPAVAAALLQALAPSDDRRGAPLAAEAVEEVLQRPLGVSRILAGLDGDSVVLVDTGTCESLGLERPEATAFAIIELGETSASEATSDWERLALVESTVERLRGAGFPSLSSLRKLEHQDLPDALLRVEPSARPLIHHLVTEDRRIPRMVAALKRADPQILGALLLMSQASRREEHGDDISPVIDHITRQAEGTEGIYGARLSGSPDGRRIVVVGRSFLLPAFLDALANELKERFEIDAQSIIV